MTIPNPDNTPGASELSEILIARWELAHTEVSDPRVREAARLRLRELAELLYRMATDGSAS
ncbi:MAG TPA: hypothetical protein VGJ13_05075 [Pseudonocardiaceae bacterium]